MRGEFLAFGVVSDNITFDLYLYLHKKSGHT
jgi:hypothetical protein